MVLRLAVMYFSAWARPYYIASEGFLISWMTMNWWVFYYSILFSKLDSYGIINSYSDNALEVEFDFRILW